MNGGPARQGAAFRRRLALRLVEGFGGTVDARKHVAAGVQVSDRTMRRWAALDRQGQPLAKPVGRPPDAVAREDRQGLIVAMVKLGPRAGVNVLRALCPKVPFRTIAKMKARFCRAIRRRLGWYRKRLEWLRANRVWAMDFTQPKARLPGVDGRLFLVRDLASGATLAAVPCRGERADVVCTVLTALFLLLGVPLVIKHDNGGAFTAGETTALLDERGVVALPSPTYTPQYNGSCERGGGNLKAGIEHAALRAGHPGEWTRADIAEALQAGNTTARPWGARGPTPAEVLAQRRPLEPGKREAFQESRRKGIQERLETHEAAFGMMPTCTERAAIDRIATQDALCKHGYLQFRRGRLSTPIQTWKAVTKA